MKRIITTLLFIFVSISFALADEVPARPSADSLVIDFAQLLNPEERNALETKLRSFKDESGIEFIALTANSFGQMKSEEYIANIEKTWNIGGAERNGIILLVRPLQKDISSLINVRVGFGAQPLLSQGIAQKRTIEEGVPLLNQQLYSKAINHTATTLINEIDIPEPQPEVNTGFTTKDWIIFSAIGVAIIAIVIYMARSNKIDDEQYRQSKAERKRREQEERERNQQNN